METPKETPRTFKLESVPDANIVDIKLSGYFIKIMQQLLVALGEKIGKDRVNQITQKIQNQVPLDDTEELTIFVMLSLIDAAEKAARAQNKTIVEEYTEEQLRKIIEDLD
jgi:hypothetical protein